jgi:hypothetical protein
VTYAEAHSVSESRSWPNLALIAGGLLIVPMWVRYTTLHGPTTVDEGRHWFGQGPGFWGSMMEGPAGLLIALGLAGSYPLLTGNAGRTARVGFVLAMIGAVIPPVVDLALREVIPPLLAPLFGVGLILMAVANRANPALTNFSLLLLAGLGGALLSSFLWALLVRPDLTDRIDGYRIYGVVANALFGLGWVVFGASLAWKQRAAWGQGQATA